MARDFCWRSSAILWWCQYIQNFHGTRTLALIPFHLEMLELLIFVMIFLQLGFFLFLSFPIILLLFPFSALPMGCNCREYWCVGYFGIASMTPRASFGGFYIGLCSSSHKPIDGTIGNSWLQPTWLGMYLVLVYWQKLPLASGNDLI